MKGEKGWVPCCAVNNGCEGWLRRAWVTWRAGSSSWPGFGPRRRIDEAEEITPAELGGDSCLKTGQKRWLAERDWID